MKPETIEKRRKEAAVDFARRSNTLRKRKSNRKKQGKSFLDVEEELLALQNEEKLVNLRFDAQAAFHRYQDNLRGKLSRAKKKGKDTTDLQNQVDSLDEETFINDFIAKMADSDIAAPKQVDGGRRRRVSNADQDLSGKEASPNDPPSSSRNRFVSPIMSMSKEERSALTPSQIKRYMECNRRLLASLKNRENRRQITRQIFDKLLDHEEYDRDQEFDLEYDIVLLSILEDNYNPENAKKPAAQESILNPAALSSQGSIPEASKKEILKVVTVSFQPDGWSVQDLSNMTEFLNQFWDLYQVASSMTQDPDDVVRKEGMKLVSRFLAFCWQNENLRQLLQARLYNEDEAVKYFVSTVTQHGFWNSPLEWWNAHVTPDVSGLVYFISSVYIPHFRPAEPGTEPQLYHYRLLDDQGGLSELVAVTIDDSRDGNYIVRQKGTTDTCVATIEYLQPL